MKKRLTIGLIVGATVFAAVFAMAATLGITSDDLAAGNEVVATCDTDGVTVGYTTAFDDTDDRYEVTEVTVSGIAVACDGQDISVTLMDGTTALTTQNGTLGNPSGGSHTIVLGTAQSAEAVDGVHVVISG